MIESILVPTDGSALSERALPIAKVLAGAQGAEVMLVQVIAPTVWPMMSESGLSVNFPSTPELYQQVKDQIDHDAERNLHRLAQSLEFHTPRIRTRTELLHGSPYAMLLECEAEEKPDILVMATHGRTGLARFTRGSTADRLVRQGTTPVLLVPSFGPEVDKLECALVPLDGSALAEEALSMVEALAKNPLTHVHLVRAISLAAEADEATAYLDGVAKRLRALGLNVAVTVREGQPSDVIATLATTIEFPSIKFVIMATHGRGGWDRLRHGSVAEHALHELRVSVLLVRAGQIQERPGSD